MNVHQYVRANPIDDPPGAVIHCSRCGRDQPPEAFYLSRARRCFAEGAIRRATTRCRDCGRGDMTRLLAEKRKVVADAKAAGCVDCGLVMPDHPEVFDFDHVQPGKVKPVAQWVTTGTIDDILEEIARCEVVCANCHRIRTASRPHGKAGSDLR